MFHDGAGHMSQTVIRHRLTLARSMIATERTAGAHRTWVAMATEHQLWQPLLQADIPADSQAQPPASPPRQHHFSHRISLDLEDDDGDDLNQDAILLPGSEAYQVLLAHCAAVGPEHPIRAEWLPHDRRT
jgi:hypothetical protein